MPTRRSNRKSVIGREISPSPAQSKYMADTERSHLHAMLRSQSGNTMPRSTQRPTPSSPGSLGSQRDIASSGRLGQQTAATTCAAESTASASPRVHPTRPTQIKITPYLKECKLQYLSVSRRHPRLPLLRLKLFSWVDPRGHGSAVTPLLAFCRMSMMGTLPEKVVIHRKLCYPPRRP